MEVVSAILSCFRSKPRLWNRKYESLKYENSRMASCNVSCVAGRAHHGVTRRDAVRLDRSTLRTKLVFFSRKANLAV